MIIKGKNKKGENLEYDVFAVREIRHERFKTDYDIVVTGEIEVITHCLIYPEGNRDAMHSSLVINIFDKDITPDQWMEIPGFIEAFKRAREYYTLEKKSEYYEGRKRFNLKSSPYDKILNKFKKFYSKLSDENKLILEVI